VNLVKESFLYVVGIAELVFSAIQAADIDMRNELYKHIGERSLYLHLLCFE
jgi:hypothetical protein